MLLLTFPALAFWLLIFFGTTYYHVLVARFFQGFTAGGILNTMILYIADIANDKYEFQDTRLFTNDESDE